MTGPGHACPGGPQVVCWLRSHGHPPSHPGASPRGAMVSLQPCHGHAGVHIPPHEPPTPLGTTPISTPPTLTPSMITVNPAVPMMTENTMMPSGSMRSRPTGYLYLFFRLDCHVVQYIRAGSRGRKGRKG